MRCLIVTANDPLTFGGVERFVQTLINSLSPRDVVFDIVHVGVTTYRPSWYDRYGFGEVRKSLWVSRSASAAIRRLHYDCVIANGISGWALRETAIPIINVHHGTIRGATRAVSQAGPATSGARRLKRIAGVALSYWLSGGLERHTSMSARVNVAVSRSTRDELVNLYGVDPCSVRVIQNGVDTDHFKPRERDAARIALGLPGDAFIILFSGRNELRKGSDKLIQLADLLASSDPSILLVAATNRRLESQHIRNMERVAYKDLPALYSAADVFVFPSLYEGCSFSVIEAMACGLPFVITDVGHARDIRECSRVLAPFIVPASSSAKQFADLVLTLRRDDDIRRALGVEARRYVVEHNSVQVMASAYLELFREIAGHRQGSAT